MPHKRRTFMQGTALAAGSLISGCSTASTSSWKPRISRSVKGANDDIRMACIGIGKKGKHHLSVFSQLPGVRVVALCDPDEAQIAKHAKDFDPPYAYETFTDVRDVIRNRDKHVELVLTGRDASQELIDMADLVTEMKPIKHPFDQGIGARKGIEY